MLVHTRRANSFAGEAREGEDVASPMRGDVQRKGSIRSILSILFSGGRAVPRSAPSAAMSVPRAVASIAAMVAAIAASFCQPATAGPDTGEADAARPTQLLDVTVRETWGLDQARPATGGVPLAQGAAPEGTRFALADEGGRPVPIQASVLARWKDGSARWVLLDFQARPPVGGEARYRLTRLPTGTAHAPRSPVRVVELDPPKRAVLDSGTLRLSRTEDALLTISDRVDVKLEIVDAAGRRCRGVVESATVETAGSLRSTLALVGAFRAPDGERIVGFRTRASVFAGRSDVLVEPLIVVDSARSVIQRIRALELRVIPRKPVASATLGGEPGWRGTPGPSRTRLLQFDDRHYRLEGVPGGAPKIAAGGKAPGWAAMADAGGTTSLAVRDFWQGWPKSLEVGRSGLTVGLFPAFEAGTFDHMEPWYKHQYLFDGSTYRLRAGQARRWQIWIDVSKDGGPGAVRATAADRPAVVSADPIAAIASGVWGPIAAAGTRGMEEYDPWAENLFVNGYLNSITTQRDYGVMNWGDWWGERGCNWGNHEYDTPRHILAQFARTGDPRYLWVGDTAARHTSEVDVVHFVNDDLRRHFGVRSDYPARPGLVHQHCVGHVSGFYSVDRIRELYVSLGVGKSQRPYLCLDPYNLGHIWTQGMMYAHFLTGDPWLRETVEKIGDNLARLVEDRKFRFRGHSHCGRVNGWTMLAIAGAYELDFDDRYLRAMRLLADDALSEQNPETGGWHYRLPWGHCYCDKKHVGEAAFISAVRLNGLSRYWQLTGDDRIPDAVRRGVARLCSDTWEEEHSGWRYTSCPKSASGPGRQTGVIVQAYVNSVTMTQDAEQLRILRKAWKAKFERLRKAPASRPGFGKSYSTTMLGCPEAMNLFVNGSGNTPPPD